VFEAQGYSLLVGLEPEHIDTVFNHLPQVDLSAVHNEGIRLELAEVLDVFDEKFHKPGAFIYSVKNPLLSFI
jgi:hypothetical protein